MSDTDHLAPKIATERLRELSQLQPWKSTALIAVEWAAAIAAASAAWHAWHPITYVLAVMFIGARQHSLGIMMHEGAHYRLARDKRVNDWLSELLCAWPLLFVSTRAYRRNHLAHHKHLNTSRDPDLQRKQGPQWVFPRARELLVWLLGTALGGGLLRTLRLFRNIEPSRRPTTERAFVIGRGLFLVTVAVALTLTHTWLPFLLLWVVPLVTWALVAQEIRSVGEHHGIPQGAGVFAGTRTTHPTLVDRLFVLSYGVHFHMEHHLYPSVPIYQLAALHEALCEHPSYTSSLHQTRGYHRVLLQECAA